MELDDLKQSWKSSVQEYQPVDYNLDKILARKADDPLNILRRKYKRQVIALPLAILLLTGMYILMPEVRKNAMLLIGIPLLLVQTIRYYMNYKLILKMQEPGDSGVKQHLEKNLKGLQKNASQDLRLLRAVLLLYILAMEVTIHYQLVPAYQSWAEVPAAARAAVYLLLMLVQPYVSSYFFNFHFGRYISRLKELVDQAA